MYPPTGINFVRHSQEQFSNTGPLRKHTGKAHDNRFGRLAVKKSKCKKLSTVSLVVEYVIKSGETVAVGSHLVIEYII